MNIIKRIASVLVKGFLLFFVLFVVEQELDIIWKRKHVFMPPYTYTVYVKANRFTGKVVAFWDPDIETERLSLRHRNSMV